MAKIWDSLKNLIKDPRWLKQTEQDLLVEKIREQLEGLEVSSLTNWFKLQKEPIQAATLALMPPKYAADLCSQLSEELAVKLVQKIASLEKIELPALEALHQDLEMIAASQTQNSRHMSGIATVIRMMQQADPEMRNTILKNLEEKAPKLKVQIQAELLTLEKLLELSSNHFALVCSQQKDRALAILCAKKAPTIKEKILACVSSNRNSHLLKEIECIGLLRLKEVDEAVAAFLATAEKLHEQGKIIYPWEDKVV